MHRHADPTVEVETFVENGVTYARRDSLDRCKTCYEVTDIRHPDGEPICPDCIKSLTGVHIPPHREVQPENFIAGGHQWIAWKAEDGAWLVSCTSKWFVRRTKTSRGHPVFGRFLSFPDARAWCERKGRRYCPSAGPDRDLLYALRHRAYGGDESAIEALSAMEKAWGADVHYWDQNRHVPWGRNRGSEASR